MGLENVGGREGGRGYEYVVCGGPAGVDCAFESRGGLDREGGSEEDGFAIFGYAGGGLEGGAVVEEAEKNAVEEEDEERDAYVGAANWLVEKDEY